VAYPVLDRLAKARRPLAAAWTVEVGGCGGLGCREEQRPARTGGAALPCGAVAVAVAAYILHLSESTPGNGETSRYSVCTGEIA
jgi:hypothetical protein